MRLFQCLTVAVLILPVAVLAQTSSPAGGPTQSRDGLATADQGKTSNNGLPSGSVNAETGPQSRPAYPSGSTTANPGAAFVKTMPVPATGPAAAPSGVLSTTTTGSAGSAKTGGPGVGQAVRPAK